MGNDASKDFSLDEKIETVSKNIWTLYRCTNADGFPLSVFVYDLTSPHCKPQFVENAAKYLKVLRHPYIIKFHALSHSSEGSWLITEHATPLEILIDSLSADEIIAGLYNLIEALSFLHDRGGLCHNNVGLSSVFVADDGTWKLGAMECVCPFADASSAFLIRHQAVRSEKAIAPEEKDVKLFVGSGYGRDVYAFGCFAECILEYLTDLGEKTKTLQKMIQEELLNAVPNLRPNLSVLLDDSLFKTDFIEICNFLKHITVKSEEEKNKFFRVIVEKLYRLPQQLIATRLVKPLLSRFVVLDPEACQHLIPHLLMPASGSEQRSEYKEGEVNPVLAEPFFQSYVIPEIYKIFHVRDAHIRSILLRHFHHYARLFDQRSLTEVIFPQILLSVRDANDELVMLSLNAIAFLVPILGGDIIVGSERPKLFYEGIPKFSAVNGHVNVVPNGISNVLRENCPESDISVTFARKSTDNGTNASHGSAAAAEKRQRKREEARKQMEERRKKREEEQKLIVRGKDFSSVPASVEIELENKDRHPENFEQCDKDIDSAMEVPRSPQSPHYERTDSEIELEIEAELEAMILAEAKADNSPARLTDNDGKQKVTVDWSNASCENASPLSKHSKGRLKFTASRTRNDTGSSFTEDRQVDTTLKTTGHKITSSEFRTKVDDRWEDAGWEDFDAIPKSSSSPSEVKNSSQLSPVSAKGIVPPTLSRMRSVQEPLGAGYDIMLIDVKKKTPDKEEEFDFFADMVPEIKSSGNNLINILAGGNLSKGHTGVPKSENTSSFSSSSSSMVSNMPLKSAALHTFDMVAMDTAGVTQEASGWDAELDWNVDDQL